MKLDHFLVGGVAVLAVSLACGCSSSVRPAATAAAPEAPAAASTTQLMSAETSLGTPAGFGGAGQTAAPKVGKSSRATEEEEALGAPKEPRRHGAYRDSRFGTSK